MIRLNLLPNLKKDFLRAQRMRRRTIAVAILVTIISIGSLIALGIYVYGAQNVIMAVQTTNIENKYKELRETKDIDKYLTVQNQLKSIASLHSDKYDIGRVIDFTTKVNIPDKPATYLEVAADMNTEVLDESGQAVTSNEIGTMEVRGFISDFAAFKRLQDSFANATVSYTVSENGSDEEKKDIKVFTLSGSPELSILPDNNNFVGFTIKLSVLKEPFKWKAKNVVIVVPNLDTTDSSQNTPNPFGGGE